MMEVNRCAFISCILVIDFIDFYSGSSQAMIRDKFSVGGRS